MDKWILSSLQSNVKPQLLHVMGKTKIQMRFTHWKINHGEHNKPIYVSFLYFNAHYIVIWRLTMHFKHSQYFALKPSL